MEVPADDLTCATVFLQRVYYHNVLLPAVHREHRPPSARGRSCRPCEVPSQAEKNRVTLCTHPHFPPQQPARAPTTDDATIA
jgi:hypothetical protein